MTPLHLLAHALHDSAALGVSPWTLAVAIAGILTVAIVLPQRAEEPRVALPEPSPDRPVDARGVDAAAPADAATEADGVAASVAIAGADEVDEPVVRVRAPGVVVALVALALGVVGLFGADDPNLASLTVANVVLPLAVLVGLLGGGPRRGAVAARPGVHPLTWVLLVPVVLTHPAGSAGGTVAGLVLLGYAAVSLVGRARTGPGWWADGDPLGVLVALVRRLSPLARDAGGTRRPWLAALWDPLTATERAVLLVVLAGAVGRAARFLPVWLDLMAGQPIEVRAVAALALTVYVGLLLVLVHRAVRRRTGADVAVATVPIVAAVLLANDATPALFTLNFAGTLLSDPLGTGLDLFGTADRTIGTGLLLSPLVWLWQLVVVLAAGGLATTAQRDLDRAAGRTGPGPAIAAAAVAATVVGLLLLG